MLIVIVIFMFWQKYNLDINLYIDKLKYGDEYGIEKMVTVKAHDFINRVSYDNDITHSINRVDNYFDNNCDIYLADLHYTYDKDIRSKIIESLKHRRNSNEGLSLTIYPTRSSAKIINFDEDQVNVEVNGYFKVIHEHDYGELDEAEEFSYEYTVTFEKKFLFVWKATHFRTNSDVIKNIMNGFL